MRISVALSAFALCALAACRETPTTGRDLALLCDEVREVSAMPNEQDRVSEAERRRLSLASAIFCDYPSG